MESHLESTKFITDDWRAIGRGEQMESSWTGYTEFRWKRKREVDDTEERERDLAMEFGDSGDSGATGAVGSGFNGEQEEGTSEVEMVPGSNDTIQPSTASQSGGSDVMEEDGTSTPLIEVISGPTTITEPLVTTRAVAEGPSTYGPIRETALTRALRRDAQGLDGHRPAGHAVSSDVLNTELCCARWVKGANGWKIDWELAWW